MMKNTLILLALFMCHLVASAIEMVWDPNVIISTYNLNNHIILGTGTNGVYNDAVIIIDSDVDIAPNTYLPENLTLEIREGAMLKFGNGASSVKLMSPIKAGAYQIFDFSDITTPYNALELSRWNGATSLTEYNATILKPEWWGQIFDHRYPGFPVDNHPATFLITKPIPTVPDLVLHKNICLKFENYGQLIIDDQNDMGTDLTDLKILGTIDAGRQHIFNVKALNKPNDALGNPVLNEDSDIIFGTQRNFYPEWWGVVSSVDENDLPSATNNYVFSRQMMLDIGYSGGGHIQFAAGLYLIRDLVIDFDNITVSGAGAGITTLKYDVVNHNYSQDSSIGVSTRQGGLFIVQGPTVNGANGNYTYTAENQKQIENIVVRDLSIAFDSLAATVDPLMNGLTIVNAKNVSIDHVNVDLYKANRAFYIYVANDHQKTEKVTIQDCYVVNSRTGVFVKHIGSATATGGGDQSIKDIAIVNNEFNVSAVPYSFIDNSDVEAKHWADIVSSGIAFENEGEFTNTLDQDNMILGQFTIAANVFNNADVGIRFKNQDTSISQYRHVLNIKDNQFYNFKYFGIWGIFKNANIEGNTFDSVVMEGYEKDSDMPVDSQFDRYNTNQFFFNVKSAPIAIIKQNHIDSITNGGSYIGPDFVNIGNNMFRNALTANTNYQLDATIYLKTGNSSTVNVYNNYFLHEQLDKNVDQFKAPLYEILCFVDSYNDDTTSYSGLMSYRENKFRFTRKNASGAFSSDNDLYIGRTGPGLQISPNKYILLDNGGNYFYGN